MEYAKDEVFSIYYNKKKDKLEYSRFINRILNNKFMALLITMGVVFGMLDITLIYYFFKILNTI